MGLNRMTDHATLKPETTEAAIQEIIDEVKEYNFFSVCINSYRITFVNEQLADTDITMCTVIGFPSGANTPEVRAYETADATRNGANEVGMVINIGILRSQQYNHVCQDIQGVVDAAKEKALVRVIIETALLTDEEEVKAYELAKGAGADFVKTSTGFLAGDVKVADIRLMRETVGPDMDVKASGGVHNAGETLTMIKMGATHIGASTGVAIVSGVIGEGYQLVSQIKRRCGEEGDSKTGMA